jgi:hypothetical protein
VNNRRMALSLFVHNVKITGAWKQAKLAVGRPC